MPIRWGIIGCGNVTEAKSGPAFSRVADSRLVAVMRRRGNLAADYARRHNVPRWYDNAEDLINDPQVDAVYIATPPGSHLEHALRVAAAGKPAYVEKPMARNHAECLQMLEAFDRAGVPLFVAYYRRALPRFLRAKELIEKGRIGTVTGVSLRYADPRHWRVVGNELEWRLVAEHAGGGLFLDLASHTLDIIDFILGPLTQVGGSAANRTANYLVEDTVAMHFMTGCGAVGTGSWNFASFAREDLIQITGTAGQVTLSTFGNDPVKLTTTEETRTFELPNPPHIQEPLIQSIVDHLLGRGTCPSTGASAARTSRVIDQVLAGYYGGRDDAFWSRPDSWPGRQCSAQNRTC